MHKISCVERTIIMFHVAIIGAGNIAEKMAETLNQMTEASAYAVASRDLEKAKAFAKKFHMEKAYGSYEEMMQDQEIDLVYVATPHSFHYEHMMLCLKHGKNVLCEKPFTVTCQEAEKALSYAEEQGLFVTEAMWTRYLPQTEVLKSILEEKPVGKVSMVTANLGYPLSDIPRMYKPESAGGAMLDLGCYPLHFVAICLGDQVESVTCHIDKYSTGVDAQNVVTLQYPDNVLAISSSTMMAKSDRKGVLFCENGYIVVENVNNYEDITVYDSDYQEIRKYPQPPQITGFEYQVLASKEAIESGNTQCTQLPHKEILRIVKMMEECLH